MNYVYCSDLKNHQVLGTFLETLHHLALNKKKPIPLVVVGLRDAHKIPALKDFISRKLNIDNGIYKSNNEYPLDKEEEKKVNIEIQNKNIKGLEYKGINIGTGISSSIISKHRCINPRLDKLQNEFMSYTQQAMLFLESFQKAIVTHVTPEDTVYIYNGRHYNTHPQTLFCEQYGCNIMYYERMNSWKNLRIQKPRIHDFISSSHIVKHFWETSKNPEKKRIGELFFETNTHNKFTAKFSEKIDSDKKIISYFASSEDEYASLDPRISLSEIFNSQREALTCLLKWAASQKKYTLIVRLHPNQENICSSDYDYWHNISEKNVKIIPSQSNISSYDIIKKSAKVISFLSTVGIEATRMGVPSITLGNPIYKGIDAVYEPRTKEDLYHLLNNELVPKTMENTIPYGYFNLKFGHDMKLMEKIGITDFSQYPTILNQQHPII